MRPLGRAGSNGSRGPRGHACCLHRDAAEYRRRLASFSTQALRDGLRVAYAGQGDPESSRADLAGVGDLDRLLADGAVRIQSVADVYGPGGPVDPERLVATHAAATEAALAAGFRGLAVSADVTDLVRTPEQQDAFARYEFLVDRYMAAQPLSALCGYRLELGSDTVAEFAALHTVAPAGEAAFRVFGCADGALGLRGQCGPVSVAVLGRVLTRLRTGPRTGAFAVDLSGVEYVDHRLLRTLDDHARAHGLVLSLRSAPSFVARLLPLLPTPYLQHSEGGSRT